MNEKEITSYTDYREYEKAHKDRRRWSKANDYAVYTWSMCSECIYFQASTLCHLKLHNYWIEPL
jgi:hypothetical protein